VDTDEKKQACFKQGLSSKLQDCSLEDAHLVHKVDKKRKALAAGSSISSPQRFCLV
jgi:hypothetical protein